MINSRMKILQATKFAGGITLLIGMIIFLYGVASGFSTVVGIGIGTVVGAALIFLMGIFFITTEEMVDNTFKGIEIKQMKSTKVTYLRRIQ